MKNILKGISDWKYYVLFLIPTTTDTTLKAHKLLKQLTFLLFLIFRPIQIIF